MTRVLVTGASGFVGSQLCAALSGSGCTVRAALRKDQATQTAEKIVVGDITSTTAWGEALRDVDCVFHLAARAHVLQADDRTVENYTETNARGTRGLARAAAEHGVPKLIYLSSVKVNGEQTEDRAYTASDQPHPHDPYAVSKWLGERYLKEVGAQTAMRAIIVRSPLVYGPGVQGNFLRLMRWVDSGWPIPLGSVRNARSLVNLWNLCDLLAALATNPAAPAGTWMVSDGEDLSTPELLRPNARAMRRSSSGVDRRWAADRDCCRCPLLRCGAARVCSGARPSSRASAAR